MVAVLAPTAVQPASSVHTISPSSPPNPPGLGLMRLSWKRSPETLLGVSHPSCPDASDDWLHRNGADDSSC